MTSADNTPTLPRIVAVDLSVMRVRAFAQWAHGGKLIFEHNPLDFLDDVAQAASEFNGAPESLIAIIKAAYLHRVPLDTDVPDEVLELLFPATAKGPSPSVIALTVSRETDQPLPDPRERKLEGFMRIFNGGVHVRCLSLCERFTRAMWARMKRLPATVLEELRAEHNDYKSLTVVYDDELKTLWKAYEEAIGR